jgi:hypothetical protein
MMFKFIYSLVMFQQLDPRIYELQKDIELYKIIITGSVLLIVILVLIVILQRISLAKIGHVEKTAVIPKKTGAAAPAVKNKVNKEKTAGSEAVSPKDLPDPGLVFKYSLAQENVTEKLITIGQTDGNIKTYSTEIMNDHLSIHIRILENREEKDIYNLPDKIFEEYIVDFRREGKALIYYPGLETFRQMGSREKIFLMREEDPAGDPTFPTIDPKQPIRIRLGERLNQDEKFVNGYFEFHLFNQEYEAKTSAGIKKIEKNFMLRLYRVYPGYDVSSPDANGLYPMMDPFRSAGK